MYIHNHTLHSYTRSSFIGSSKTGVFHQSYSIIFPKSPPTAQLKHPGDLRHISFSQVCYMLKSAKRVTYLILYLANVIY